MIPSDETPVPGTFGGAPAAPDRWFGELDQPDFEIDFYQRILHHQPNDIRLLRLLGELYARRGLHERAAQIDQKLLELTPEDGVVHYHLACSLAMQGAHFQAIETLGRALQCGYNDYGHLEVDPDLESLRRLPQYQALLRQFGLS
jgi:tetratricopeptide (TPR) repeat protein